MNAYHSNELIEKMILLLQYLARAMLIHQNITWEMPDTINLWLCALRMANDAINKSPNSRKYEG